MKGTLIILAILFSTVIFIGSVNAQAKDDMNKTETKIGSQEYDQNIVIKKYPKVKRAKSCLQKSLGIIELKVTFDKSAVITDVIIISSSGCDDTDKNAVMETKKIKFKPATKNGQPVTITKSVKFTYNYV